MESVFSNKEEFVEKALRLHGDKYDYSSVEYVRSSQDVLLRCPEHGTFKQCPNSHLNGRGCPRCGRIRTHLKKRSNLKDFINRAIQKHGILYDYSLSRYEKCSIKMDIVCPKHGLFKQTPGKHLYGQGCPRCARELVKYNQMSTAGFIDKAKKIHGDRYDYSRVNYNSSNKKVKIVCLHHGIFEQTPNNHLMGMNCVKCAIEINALRHSYSTEKFIEKAKRIHGSKYDYSVVDYKGSFIKVKIICPEHGIFLQQPYAHLNDRGCPLCQESRGERKIALFLKSHKLSYRRQKTFDQCKNIRNLHYDFYVPKLNTCIEYDGRQHFFPSEFFGGIPAFQYLQKTDAIKNKFCSSNGIRLIRIPYNKYNKVESILEKELISKG